MRRALERVYRLAWDLGGGEGSRATVAWVAVWVAVVVGGALADLFVGGSTSPR